MLHKNMWWSLPLTLGIFFASCRLASRVRIPLLNPLLVSMVVIIALLLATGIPYNRYNRYFSGSKVLNDLLQPVVVALAYRLYELLHQICARWKSIISICFAGSLTANGGVPHFRRDSWGGVFRHSVFKLLRISTRAPPAATSWIFNWIFKKRRSVRWRWLSAALITSLYRPLCLSIITLTQISG